MIAIDARCKDCGSTATVVRLGIACRACGSRKLEKVRPGRKPAAPPPPPKRESGNKAELRSNYDDLPPQGRRLREFMDAEGLSERGLARLLHNAARTAAARNKEEKPRFTCSRSMVQGMIYGRSRPGWDLSRAIAWAMRARGYKPCEFYPMCADPKLKGKPPFRRDVRDYFVERSGGVDPWR